MENPARFRKLIENRLSQLQQTRALAASGAETVELDQTRVGRLSRMDALQMQQMNLELERRTARELVALQHALKRIEEGCYGICAQCAEAINPKRLEIDLCAGLCIDCASGRRHE